MSSNAHLKRIDLSKPVTQVTVNMIKLAAENGFEVLRITKAHEAGYLLREAGDDIANPIEFKVSNIAMATRVLLRLAPQVPVLTKPARF